MVIAVRTERGMAGLEVVKEADTAADRARLQREATLLRRAAQPGVVEVVDASPGVLRLRHRGTSLARLGALPPDQAAAVVRALADTVSALHRQGIAHTRICADHVVVGDRGRPRLCGFAEATEATPDTEAADVAALGRLLDELLDAGADALWSPRLRGLRQARTRRRARSGLRAAARAARRDDPAQRPSARQLARAVHVALPDLTLPAAAVGGLPHFTAIPEDVDPTADLGWNDDDLSFLAVDDDWDDADWATGRAADGDADDDVDGAGLEPDDAHPEPDDAHPDSDEPADDLVRPTAGLTVSPPVPTSGPSPSPVPTDGPAPIRMRPGPEVVAPAPDRRLIVGVAAVLLVVGAVAGSVVARAVHPFGAPDAAATVPTTMPASTTTTEPAPAPPPLPPGCPEPDVRGPDVDGDECPDPVVLDDRIANVGNVQVELGAPGDLAVVADSDCDGLATPVLLRPSSGEVFVFEEWSLHEPIEVEAVTVVAGAERIAADDGCGPVRVTAADGRSHVVTGR